MQPIRISHSAQKYITLNRYQKLGWGPQDNNKKKTAKEVCSPPPPGVGEWVKRQTKEHGISRLEDEGYLKRKKQSNKKLLFSNFA